VTPAARRLPDPRPRPLAALLLGTCTGRPLQRRLQGRAVPESVRRRSSRPSGVPGGCHGLFVYLLQDVGDANGATARCRPSLPRSDRRRRLWGRVPRTNHASGASGLGAGQELRLRHPDNHPPERCRMLTSRSILATALTLMAGCATVGPLQPSDQPTPLAPPLLENCLATLSSFTYFQDRMPLRYPEGWNDTLGPQATLETELIHCNHVTWGPFSRPNITFVVELGNRGVPPDACRFNHPDFYNVLQTLYVSDQEMATYLRETGHLPAHDLDIHLEVQQNAPIESLHWTWTLGGNQSELTSLANMDGRASRPTTERWFWSTPGGLGAMDLTSEFTSGNQLLAHQGSLKPPMLYASINPSGDYVGYGTQAFDYQGSGVLYQFGDAQCASRSSLPSS